MRLTLVQQVQHITVDAKGRLSLWDSADAALRGRQEGEAYVELVLAEAQVAQLERVRRGLLATPWTGALLLQAGDRVVARRVLDKRGANVQEGTRGVVFAEAGAFGDGAGPCVRWETGAACNVYPGDVGTL